MYSIYHITEFQCAQANLAPKVNQKATSFGYLRRHFADVITLEQLIFEFIEWCYYVTLGA